jgi:hypothetical protein
MKDPKEQRALFPKMKNNSVDPSATPSVGNPARRRFIARLSKTAAVAVPLAMVATVGLPKAHAY